MGRYALVFCSLLWPVGWTLADPYSVTYEANTPGEFAEDVGFDRRTDHGGAKRSVANGVFTLSSLNEAISDSYEFDGHERMNPGAGELFFAEWRMRVMLGSEDGDVQVYIAGDHYGGAVSIGWSEDRLSVYHQGWREIDTTTYHVYRLESQDMREYEFFIDGFLESHGTFGLQTTRSSVFVWGDPGMRGPDSGLRSSSQWDYCRLGVTTLPSAPAMVIFVCLVVIIASGRISGAVAHDPVGRKYHPLCFASGRGPKSVAHACRVRLRTIRGVLGAAVSVQAVLVLWFLVGFVLSECRIRPEAPYTGRPLAVAAGVFAGLCVLLHWLPRWAYWRFRRFLRGHEFAVCTRCAHSLQGLPAEHVCPGCGRPYQLSEVQNEWREWAAS